MIVTMAVQGMTRVCQGKTKKQPKGPKRAGKELKHMHPHLLRTLKTITAAERVQEPFSGAGNASGWDGGFGADIKGHNRTKEQQKENLHARKWYRAFCRRAKSRERRNWNARSYRGTKRQIGVHEHNYPPTISLLISKFSIHDQRTRNRPETTTSRPWHLLAAGFGLLSCSSQQKTIAFELSRRAARRPCCWVGPSKVSVPSRQLLS